MTDTRDFGSTLAADAYYRGEVKLHHLNLAKKKKDLAAVKLALMLGKEIAKGPESFQTRGCVKLREKWRVQPVFPRPISLESFSDACPSTNNSKGWNVLGEYRRAIEYYEQDLRIAREIGDRRGQGNALWNVSLAFDKLGERAQAIPLAEAALKIYEQIESPYAAMVRTQLAEWRGGAEGRRHSAEGGRR